MPLELELELGEVVTHSIPLVSTPTYVLVDCCVSQLALPVQLRCGTQAHQEHASVLELCFATAEVVLFQTQ
jgi:hypothetical protein